MNLPYYFRHAIAGLHAASFAAYLGWLLLGGFGRRGHYDGGVLVVAVFIGGLTILPAVALLRGAWGWKRGWAVATGFVLFLWLLLPLSQHAIDRTPMFWGLWGYFGVLLVAFGWAAITWRGKAGAG